MKVCAVCIFKLKLPLNNLSDEEEEKGAENPPLSIA